MRVLALAYACEPDRGSEPGAGWSWARMIGGFAHVTVITRANNREVIEAALPSTPEREQLTFVYVDLPAWARFWKRGGRGIHLYYVLWQIAAVRKARRLHRQRRFDIVWHLTMTNAWMGALTPLIRAPFIYGPIGGGVRTPRRLLPSLGVRGFLRECTYAVLQIASRYVNPFVRMCSRRASLILVQNAETREWVLPRDRAKTVVFPNAVIPRAPVTHHRHGSKVALFAGQLVPGKGVALAVRAMVDLPEWTLVICGKGREEPRLKQIAAQLGVGERIHFAGWIPREDLATKMANDADVFLFPSLHDQSPWVLHEARTVGLPVVCIAGCGCDALATVTAPSGWPRATARALAAAVREAETEPPPAPANFDIDTKRASLAAILTRAGFPIEMNLSSKRAS